MKDQLVECKRCQGNACYEQHIDENTTTWLCMGCGFTTSTLMDKDGPTTRSTLETSPELYKDLMYVDKDNRAWFPATITLPAKGMETGISSRVYDVVIPDYFTASELRGYLDDIYHEYSSKRYPKVE